MNREQTNLLGFTLAIEKVEAGYNTAIALIKKGEWVSEQMAKFENQPMVLGAEYARMLETRKIAPVTPEQQRVVWATTQKLLRELFERDVKIFAELLGLYDLKDIPHPPVGDAVNPEALAEFVTALLDYAARVRPLLSATIEGKVPSLP